MLCFQSIGTLLPRKFALYFRIYHGECICCLIICKCIYCFWINSILLYCFSQLVYVLKISITFSITLFIIIHRTCKKEKRIIKTRWNLLLIIPLEPIPDQ